MYKYPDGKRIGSLPLLPESGCKSNECVHKMCRRPVAKSYKSEGRDGYQKDITIAGNSD